MDRFENVTAIKKANVWTFEAGQTFEVPGRSRFAVESDVVSDYCCSYIAE